MAKRNDMSAARRSRNRKQQSIPKSSDRAAAQCIGKPESGWAPENDPADAATIVSAERNQLMKAHAVLGCVAFALLYEDWLEGSSRPSFVDAIKAVQDLIGDALDRLGARSPDRFTDGELRLAGRAVNQ